jgi:hypothetical protein
MSYNPYNQGPAQESGYGYNQPVSDSRSASDALGCSQLILFAGTSNAAPPELRWNNTLTL